MPVDSCPHTFDELATVVLPRHFRKLKAAIKTPLPAELFVGHRSATKDLLSRIGRTAEFPGCYVFISRKRPVYVGISRRVVARLVQHLNFDSHYSASLVYQMASKGCPHEMKRDQAMEDDRFRRVFLSAQRRLRQMKIAFVEVDNDLELYVLEVFAAMKLDTCRWNTFRTH